MNKLGYEVGDTVYIFEQYKLVETRVVKVTPTGLIDLQYVGQSRPDGRPYVERWLPRGRRQGSTEWEWEWAFIVSKPEQEPRRASWLAANAGKMAQRKWADDRDNLRRFDMRDPGERAKAADALRAMLADLENWP